MAGLFPRFTSAMRKMAEAAAIAKRISNALKSVAGKINSQGSAGMSIRPKPATKTTASGGGSFSRGSSAPVTAQPDILRAATAAAQAAAKTRLGEGQQNALESIAKRAGPIGEVVKAMLRPGGQSLGGIQKELEAAAKLLRQFGYTVGVPGGAGGGQSQRPRQSVEPVAPQPDEYFEEAGPEFGFHRVGGRMFQFKPDDPILTGEMLSVTSSNVHSIGYIWNNKDPMKGTLKVRFLGTNRNTSPQTRGGKGPIYHYFGVHPAIFLSFREAASKGKFVWDRLRVRGTVSGHQFPYALAKLQADGYVPRQATSRDLGSNGDYREGFVKRTVRGLDGKTYTSVLDEQWNRTIKNRRNPPPGVIAGRGAPNRGSPNRGKPNRGKP